MSMKAMCSSVELSLDSAITSVRAMAARVETSTDFATRVLGLKRVLNLLPGYPTLITRRVPGYSLQ